MISADVMREILRGYRLPRDGVHGVSHWGRVCETGRRIAARNGADLAVVECFAVFHDARRVDDGDDPGHGARGADLAQVLAPMLGLTDAQLAEMKHACRHHTDGTTSGSVTVQTCWDADRLDLWRVGIRPDPSRLCTAPGRDEELLEWTRGRSLQEVMPGCAMEWLRSAGVEVLEKDDARDASGDAGSPGDPVPRDPGRRGP